MAPASFDFCLSFLAYAAWSKPSDSRWPHCLDNDRARQSMRVGRRAKNMRSGEARVVDSIVVDMPLWAPSDYPR